MTGLLGIHNLTVHDAPRLRGSDLIDDLIVRDSPRNGCASFATFDGALDKRWKNWAFVPKPES